MLQDIEGQHEHDWGERGTYEDLLDDWRRLTDHVVHACYWEPSEYTNQLFVRDRLDDLLVECPEPLRSRLSAPMIIIDARFIAATEPDTERLLWGWHDHAEPGFWWLRIPRRGGVVDQMRADREDNRRDVARWRAFAEGRSIYDVP